MELQFLWLARVGVVVPRRLYSNWLRQIFGSKAKATIKEEKQERHAVEENVPHPSPSEYLRQMVEVHLPNHYTSMGWSAAQLTHDTHLKAKVLLGCEEQFDCNFTDRQLGSIKTFQDVLRLMDRSRKPMPLTVFPKIERTESLPANLSVQAASVQSCTRRRARLPFQNYDSPQHAVFLNKPQKEARKRKRRHLTAITKRYN